MSTPKQGGETGIKLSSIEFHEFECVHHVFGQSTKYSVFGDLVAFPHLPFIYLWQDMRHLCEAEIVDTLNMVNPCIRRQGTLACWSSRTESESEMYSFDPYKKCTCIQLTRFIVVTQDDYAGRKERRSITDVKCRYMYTKASPL